MKGIFLSILVVGLLLLCACSPARISEPPIPAHFTTYTDESGLFSISYPPEWELALSKIEAMTHETEEYMRDIGSEGSLATGGKVIFFAGIPYQTGHNPNVSIMVAPAGGTRGTLEDLVEVAVRQGYMKDAEEYHEFSRTKIVVDGRGAIILDCEAKYPLTTAELRVLTMYLRDSKVSGNFLTDNVWMVTAGVYPTNNFSDYEADLYAIVRSLRILK